MACAAAMASPMSGHGVSSEGGGELSQAVTAMPAITARSDAADALVAAPMYVWGIAAGAGGYASRDGEPSLTT
jgi:hypothetical protein